MFNNVKEIGSPFNSPNEPLGHVWGNCLREDWFVYAVVYFHCVGIILPLEKS